MATVLTPKSPKGAATIGWLQQSIHRSRSEIFSEVKTITPQLAEAILAGDSDNRNIRQYKLKQMVSDMKAGRWTLNGEPIIIAKTGELNDGQHRLNAIIESGVSVPVLFVFGVERETRTTLDQGASRTPGDYLQMEGVVNANQVAAIARQLIAYERAQKTSLGRTNDITAAEVLERVKNDKYLATAARYGNTNGPRMRGFTSGTTIGMCYYLFLDKDTNDGLAFMHQLCTGEELKMFDPALTARNRLAQLDRKSRAVQTEIIFRAWNAYRERRQLKIVPLRGQLPELI